ncbi:MAG: hypothetical protein DSY80_08380, partial [Desulfocapsa sp.]
MIDALKKNIFLTVIVLVTTCAFYVFSGSAVAASPTDDLRPTLDGMVEAIQNPAYAREENKALRREKIMEIAHRGFDFTTMSKLVLGKTYRGLNTEQRKYFVELFTKL